ncbi:hypothetical protein [Allopontixanthobacter sediminis]|uniref:Uncharacterized protein n=1 Tax=Allopontixanthobacter sediminis TaxID=1689985 RepID=A0A845AV30_9SPHN|nr:hypothetical protein [Allopontixanthobacter sediminis]MXP43403.1 hypothetical protein [Allopontixanthobacter sediminis]
MRTLLALLAATALAGCDNSSTEPVDGTEAVLPAENDDPALVERSLEGMEPLDGEAAGSSPADDISLDARTRYATYFLGAYGRDAQCGGDTATLELQQDTIRYGDTTCQIGEIEGSGKDVRISGENCTSEDAKVANRNYTMAMSEMQALQLQTGNENVSLKRCATT